MVEELFDLVPKNTYITITADHGELFGEDGYFGHGPIQHKKVFEVPFIEGSCDDVLAPCYIGPGAGFAFLGSFLDPAGRLSSWASLSFLLWPVSHWPVHADRAAADTRTPR